MIKSAFGKMLASSVLMLWVVTASATASGLDSVSLKFLKEPPYHVNFANNKGTTVECEADGSPMPALNWTLADGTAVNNIAGLREISPTGNLVLKSFTPKNFRLDVHSTVYRCAASNTAGTIHSRDVHVQGVVLQAHDIQVYDTYVIRKNVAVFKCDIPPVLRKHLKVVAWVKNDNQLIEPANSESPDSKYAIMPTGELHVRDTSLEESGSKYKCKAINTLTGETQSSSNAGQLFVTESMGIIHPKILDSASTVLARDGQTVILPCVAQGNPMPTIKWFKKGAANRTISLKTGGRYSLTTSALYVHDIRVDDEATYICEVSSEVGKEQLAISLRVSAPLSVTIQPVVQMAKNNEKVTFSCKVRGQPIHLVAWRHNGAPVKNALGDILVIDKVDASSQGIYQCFGSNDKEMVQANAELHLSDILPYFAETFHEVTTKPGSSVVIKCAASGIPNPIISWAIDEIPYENSPRLQVNSEIDRNGRVVSTLKIEKTVVSDGGLYSCTAVNKAGKSVHLGRINVYGEIGMRTVQQKIAVAGHNVYLNCPYYGYPIQEIAWEKDGRTLPRNTGQNLLKNGTLIATDVTKYADAGEYHCFTKNPTGNIVKGKVDVVILVPPKIVPFEFQDELLREGMRARLQCVVSEGDLPLNVTWLKDGEAIPPNLGVLVRVLDEFSSILTISSIIPSHNGKYTCMASNKAATVTHAAELSVNGKHHVLFEFYSSS